MELNEMEKKMLFQAEGDCQAKVLNGRRRNTADAGLPKRGGKAGTERAGKETVYAALGQTVCYRRCFVFAAARDQFGCDQPVLSERAFL